MVQEIINCGAKTKPVGGSKPALTIKIKNNA